MSQQSDATFRWATTRNCGVVTLIASIVYVLVERQLALRLPGVVVSAWWYMIAGCFPAIATMTAIAFHKTHAVWKQDYFSGILVALMIVSFAMLFPVMYSMCGFEDAFRTLESEKRDGNP